jgi:D-sedoheptulose 7-phosphate isomerase
VSPTLRKARESAELVTRFFETHQIEIDHCARALADRLASGGKLFTMGNGGSSCDAEHVAVEFTHPIIEKRRAFPAVALGRSVALTSAIGNDGDFSLVFADELAISARSSDVALALSTSGASANVNRALRKAREIGMLTIGLSGRDGGPMRELCDFAFVVPSWSLHRIQETHVVLLHVLWDQVHVALGEDDVI